MAHQTETKEHLYKILMIGDSGTGKTSIIKRYVDNVYPMNCKSTIGVDFAQKELQWSPDTVVRLQLWDIAGQERFGNMTRVYYKGALGAFVVYDVTRSSTFKGVTKWKHDLDQKVTLPAAWGGGSIPVVLLANKCDQLRNGHPVKSEAEMAKYCAENGFAKWFTTSAKENQNVDEAAQYLVSQILETEKQHEGQGRGHGLGSEERDNTIRIRNEKGSFNGCC